MSVLAIFGPTASGKSAVAEALAERIPAELVSADSMQVYTGLPILTNQPRTRRNSSASGRSGTRVRWPSTRIWRSAPSTGRWSQAAHRSWSAAPASTCGRRSPSSEFHLRLLQASADGSKRCTTELGAARAHELLAERDPAAAESVHPNDRRRVVRALELVEAGRSLRPVESRLWSEELRHPTLVFGLDVPRKVLANRIAVRTAAMLSAGAREEARAAVRAPLSRTAKQVIGLRELVELPEDEAHAAIELRTRRYAAYQRKWMRRIPGLVSLPADRPPGEIADEILEVARARELLPADRAG